MPGLILVVGLYAGLQFAICYAIKRSYEGVRY